MPELRRGWTTGACATAAFKAALTRLWSGALPTSVSLVLPRGETPVFEILDFGAGPGWAEAGVVKDAGDDPDVTHGATIRVRVSDGTGPGLRFLAGEGVGTVTRPGLPVAVGEPAINPVPRAMMDEVAAALAAEHGKAPDLDVTVSVPGGAAIALRTWNPRLGIAGGLSILGTTGVVRPFSCSAWIASIHRGIDVARAGGTVHVAGCTGATSERTVQALHGLPDHAMLDMGDFYGGLVKYLVRRPVPRLTIGGGIGKMVKLAQGAVDLHSGRSQVDFAGLAALAGDLRLAQAETALRALEIGGADMALAVAEAALARVRATVAGAGIVADVVIVDRAGVIVARGVDVLSSLAGAVRAPLLPPGRVRIGGFGGADGFRACLTAEGVRAVVDATHPFATAITARTAAICAGLTLPCLRLERPAWAAGPEDRWVDLDDAADAAATIPPGARVFLATGRQSVPAFAAALPGRSLVVRVIDAPDAPLPAPGGAWVVGRPPFTVESETALFSSLRIDWLVSKNAGGSQGRPKLDAARALGLPVAMLARPAPPGGASVETVDAAVAWLDAGGWT